VVEVPRKPISIDITDGKSHLAIFASSADVERLFSTGGLVVSPLRKSLHSSKVENILFCNRNIDRFDINEILDEMSLSNKFDVFEF
jgi:predicted RNA-binding protein YlqC (UPF0109 family)